MKNSIDPKDIEVGVVGLGLMGCSISTCLLIAGHKVIAIAPLSSDLENAEKRIQAHLQKSLEEGMVTQAPAFYLQNIEIKKSVYQKIEQVISPESILTSNTSAIPISILQKEVQFPKRFLGLHWAEPSHTTRFLEIICGENSDVTKGEYLYEIAHKWSKEPTLVRKDVRGFITNRLMYAMYREACYLVENGYASVEDVDRACRNNPGYWMTLVGVFRWMDLTGVSAYHTVMKDLLPTLSNQTTIPKLIDDVVKSGGNGVLNANGFYKYTEEEAKLWEATFQEFSYDIRALALKYPADVVEKKLKKK